VKSSAPVVGSAARASLARRRSEDSVRAVSAGRQETVTVCVPTVNESATIAHVCRELVALRDAGAIDRVVVLDDSTDATPQLAEQAGAEVVRQRDIHPEYGAVLGKGDAMWRALAVCREEVLVYVDGDTHDFSGHMACDLVAAVALDGYSFVKAAYTRPFSIAGTVLPAGGGRVTELTAKPLLRAFVPALQDFSQPLAGEIAARTALLRSLPFATGYSVDVALLMDAWRAVGLAALAEVDTGARQNEHRPLHELAAMAHEVAAAIFDRAGVPAAGTAVVNRPPMASISRLAARRPLAPAFALPSGDAVSAA
jgi:glucosyl-3-phosphoglycerate synthase